MNGYFWVALCGLWACWSLPSQAASFDCTKASTADEKAICANEVLSALDEKLAEAYKAGRSSAPFESDRKVLKYQQHEWIALRKGCVTDACIEKFTRDRIAWLEDFHATVTGDPDFEYWKHGNHAGLEQELPDPNLLLATAEGSTSVSSHQATVRKTDSVVEAPRAPEPNVIPPRSFDPEIADRFARCAAFYRGVQTFFQKTGRPVDDYVTNKRWDYLKLSAMHSYAKYAIDEEQRLVGRDNMEVFRQEIQGPDKDRYPALCHSFHVKEREKPWANEHYLEAQAELSAYVEFTSRMADRIAEEIGFQ
jgi:uncharacterized protein